MNTHMPRHCSIHTINGMTVQNPCKPDFIYKDGIIQTDFSKTEQDLVDHYRRFGWLPYQWGVW